MPYVLICFLNTIEILVVGVLLFDVKIDGSLALLLALTALFLTTTLGIGLFISTIANTQQEAMLTTLFIMLPSIFLSGFFFPLAAMPYWLQVISYFIPLRYYLIIVRGIVVKGVGLKPCGPRYWRWSSSPWESWGWRRPGSGRAWIREARGGRSEARGGRSRGQRRGRSEAGYGILG